MATLVIFNTIIPLFAIMLIGVFLERHKVLGANAIGILNSFINNIFFPVLLFGAIAKENIRNILNLPFIVAFLLVLAITYIGTFYYFNVKKDKDALINTMRAFSASCPNCAYIGIPLLVSIFGPIGLLPAAITSILTIFMMAAVIVMIEEESANLPFKKLLKKTVIHVMRNPLIIGSVLGIIYALCHSVFKLAYPDILNNFITMLGQATIPCALLSIGMVLANKKISHFSEVSIISIIKLIVSPLIALLIAKLFGLDRVYGISLVLLCALPAAVIDYVLADEYHVYVSESSAIILVSTVISLITIILLNLISVHFW